MERNGYIQLPYGFVETENEDEMMHFNLPINYKKGLLFDKLPYIAQLNNPAIENVIKGKENDDLSIRKFLLATDLLEDTIQNNFDMIVTDGEFNNAGIRQALDTKFPSVMQKPTATNFMFRDKAKFDIQNPAIGGLYNQLLTRKQKEKKELEAIGKAPSVKDTDIKKRLKDISDFNLGIRGDSDDDDDDDDNNNNNNNNNNRSSSLPPPPASPRFPLTPPNTPSSLSETQKFLLDKGGNERVAEALTSTPRPKGKQIAFSDTLTKIFPKTQREIINRSSSLESSSTLLETITEEEEEDFDITECSTVSSGIELDFSPEEKKIRKNYMKKLMKKSIY